VTFLPNKAQSITNAVVWQSPLAQAKIGSTALKFVEKSRRSMRLYPRFEMGVAVLGLAIGLPPRTGAGLFAIARTSGWIAHILEQRTAGYMLRPRSRFTFQN
jgi:citrate synthase